MSPINVVLVANYLPDAQQSMQRFAQLLERELPRRGLNVEVLRPEPFVNRTGARAGAGKYLGYIDKLLLFPEQLKKRIKVQDSTVVHICDHSNAFYTRTLANIPHVVTCHDMLAVRSARNEFTGNPTGWSGRQLQAMITRGLNAARRIVCVSEATRADVLRLTDVPAERIDVVYNGLNYPYSRMPPHDARAALRRFVVSRPLILHVGSNHWYKNRRGVLEIYAELRKRTSSAPRLVIAGEPLSEEHKKFVHSQGFASELTVISDATNEELRALYSVAELLLFPSIVEGFGWPIVEAQACGCPVVTTNRAPMTEVGGSAAVYINPDEPARAAASVEIIANETDAARQQRMTESIANAARFTTERMIDDYARIYCKIAHKRLLSEPVLS